MQNPDAGAAWVLGADVWQNPADAKARMGVLPDGIRMLDRLTGAELLRYTGLLRGMAEAEVVSRSDELLAALGLTDADLTRRGRHPEFGVVTLGQHLATWVAHDLGHIGQIVRVMARQYSEAVGPWRAFLPILGSARPPESRAAEGKHDA